AVAALTRALDDPEPFVRNRAAHALARLDPPPAAALDRLVQEVRGRDPTHRAEAAKPLEALGPKAAPVPDQLLALSADRDRAAGLGTESPAVRSALLGVLKKLGPAARPAVPAVAKAAATDNTDVALQALAALRAAKAPADEYLAHVIPALGSPDERVRAQVQA